MAVLVYKHRHGEDITVHRTPESAERQIYSYMKLWMTEIPPAVQVRLKKLIAKGQLRDACRMWQEAFECKGLDHGEEFVIIENLVVQP